MADTVGRRLRVDVSMATFFRLLAIVVVVWLWLRLWQWFLIFLVGAFLAVALDPLVQWLDRRGLRRTIGGPTIVLVLAASICGFLYLSWAELKEQGGLLGARIEEARDQIGARTPEGVRRLLPSGILPGGQPSAATGADAAGQPAGGDAGKFAISLGRSLVSGVTSIAIALVVAVYLLLDGRRTYEWFVAFAPRRRRRRIHQTAAEARTAIIGYVRGNVVTSVLAGLFTYFVLLALKVPAPLLLAILAGVFDLLPVVGFVLSLVPAVLLALTVSPAVAAWVAALFVAYNVVENYYITPRVYGHEMQLSSLAVLAAFAAGGELAGVIGALVALPMAAMYPSVERLWLRGKLDPASVDDHRRIEASEEH
jgi:predicted PurR-regulated permease PerM